MISVPRIYITFDYTERKRKKSRFYEIKRVVLKRVDKEKVSESALLQVFDWNESLFHNEYSLNLTQSLV